MRWIFIPGIHYLNKLKLTAKFGIVALLFAIPVGGMGIWNLSADTAQLNIAVLQRDGLGALSLLRNLAEHVALHRGQTNAYLGGEMHFKEKMQATASSISQDLESLVNHFDVAASELQVHNNLETLIKHWQEIEQKSLVRSAMENFSVHTKLVKDILDTMKQVGDDAALSTESNLPLHYLFRALIETLPSAAENLGLTRGIGSGRIAEGAINPEQRLRLTSLSSSVTESNRALDIALKKVFDSMPELKSELEAPLQTADGLSASFVKTTETNLISADSIDIKAESYFGAGTQAISASLALYDAIYKSVSRMIDERVANLRLLFAVTLVGMIALVGALAYLCVAFYLSIVGAVERLASAAADLANGDFRQTIGVQTRDEIALVAQSLDQLRARVAKRVCGILRSCELLVNRSEQMQYLALESREHVGSQMKDTDSLSTAITEMSVAIQEVAQTTVSAEETTTHVSSSVDEGGKTVNIMMQNITDLNNEMSRATAMISELEKRGSDINKILDVIQGIADQTNLLALNAAIEAARAGEQGRGFAVVADEVRTLAQRTQQSTLEIQQMIEQLQQGTQSASAAIASSDTNAKAALQQAEKAGSAFLEIARQVAQLSTISSQCSVTTEEQARTANEIEVRVGNLSERARDTTGAMIKSVISNSSVSTLVSEVRVLLSAFSVDENTLDAAEDSVEDLFVWTDSLATGITEIDRQHKQIVRLVNELNVNVVLKRGNHAISRTLNALAQYTVNHFAFEEKIFEQTGYSEEESHKIKHQKLLAKVQDYIKKVEGSDNEELYTELMSFVRDWLVLHIQGDDKAYTDHMKSHGID